MSDILEGRVTDVVDGEMLELAVDHVRARDPSQYGAQELVRVTGANEASRANAAEDEAAALMALTYQNRRVRCYVEERDSAGRIIGEIEVLSADEPEAIFGTTDDAER
jgi:hypothetical protein